MTELKKVSRGKSIKEVIVKAIQEKKGEELICLDLRKLSDAVCDFFIICHGESTIQIKAIADFTEVYVDKLLGEKPWHKEGYEQLDWVLLDYVDTVVHIFNEEKRYFYNLEELWSDAKIRSYKSA